MVHEPGQDQVEVQPAADVARDPSQRLGSMQQVGDLVPVPGDADDRPDRVGEDHGQIPVRHAQGVRAVLDDEERAPRAIRSRDGRRELRALARKDGRRDPFVAGGDDRDRVGVLGPWCAVTRWWGGVEGPADDAVATRQVEQTGERSVGRARDGPR